MKLKQLFLISGISYGLHYLWEAPHVALYGGYEHLCGGFDITVCATAGDTLYTLIAFFFVALVKGDVRWLARMTKLDVAAIAVFGFFISIFVEYKAFAFDRWFYLDAMPIIPFLEVGLSPVAQMTILLPLTFWLTKILSRRIDWLR